MKRGESESHPVHVESFKSRMDRWEYNGKDNVVIVVVIAALIIAARFVWVLGQMIGWVQ